MPPRTASKAATPETNPSGAGVPPRPPRTAVAAPAPLDPMEWIGQFLPERSAADVLAGEVHLVLARKRYTLPVLAIRPNREWKAGLETDLAGLLAQVEAGTDMGTIMRLLSEATEPLLGLIYTYDQSHVLPPRAEVEEVAHEGEVLQAVLAVWSAANPLLGLALAALREGPGGLPTREAPTSSSSGPSSGRPPSMAGAPGGSRPS